MASAFVAPLCSFGRSRFQAGLPLAPGPDMGSRTRYVTAFAYPTSTMISYAVARFGRGFEPLHVTCGMWRRDIGEGTARRAIHWFCTNRPEWGRKLDLLAVDGNWGQITDEVYDFAFDAPVRTVVSHSRFDRPGDALSRLALGDHELAGPHWVVPAIRPGRRALCMVWDVNWWTAECERRTHWPKGTHGVSVGAVVCADVLRTLISGLKAEG
jgi:hypothetical protein